MTLPFTTPRRLSGKAMARTGLRMMPTFPSPPLKFRTAGFPRYGFKAGISDAAFPAQLVCHRPSCPLLPSCFPALCQGRCACKHLRASGSPALPQGPSLRFGLCCPGPSSLIRPHPPHSRAHPDFTDSRLIPDALAVHIFICLGDPRLVLSFHRCSFAACRPLRPRGTLRLPVPSTSPKTLAFNLG
jgi:hypothetical protein